MGGVKEIDEVSIRVSVNGLYRVYASIVMRFARMRIDACYMSNPLDLGGYIVYNKEYAFQGATIKL